MIIDFKNIEQTNIKNFYGDTGKVSSNMFTDDMNRIMYGELEPGDSIGMHKHESSSEIIYILQGKGKAIYNGKEENLKSGICHYCPKGNCHSIINDGKEKLVFFAVVPNL